MRKTLRRSCEACAKAKHSCDLRLPKCSRCVKRKCNCIYVNEPLTLRSTRFSDDGSQTLEASKHRPEGPELVKRMVGNVSPGSSGKLMTFKGHVFDPFDSYPPTHLPRLRVQHLMQHFLSKIAFQYYPLDLNPSSNPFVTSWWPLALTDPALFHVTLQTASLDDELHSRKGFLQSEILMKDSVSLLRHKIENQSLAFQDATMNAIVTLAAIEHGKGNFQVSTLHINGVKSIVASRGGLSKVKDTSPLTARMVPWVSLLVTGSPQFDTQDDLGGGDGICAIPQWQWQFPAENTDRALLDFDTLGLDPALLNIITRLRCILSPQATSHNYPMLTTTNLHDLTCFALHRLLILPPLTGIDSQSSTLSECLRYATSAYLLLIHGATYYSHVHILNALVIRLESHLSSLLSVGGCQDPLLIWFLSIGAVASSGITDGKMFHGKAANLSAALGIQCWDDVERHLEGVIWHKSRAQVLFQQTWEEILAPSRRDGMTIDRSLVLI